MQDRQLYSKPTKLAKHFTQNHGSFDYSMAPVRYRVPTAMAYSHWPPNQGICLSFQILFPGLIDHLSGFSFGLRKIFLQTLYPPQFYNSFTQNPFSYPLHTIILTSSLILTIKLLGYDTHSIVEYIFTLLHFLIVASAPLHLLILRHNWSSGVNSSFFVCHAWFWI